MSDRLRDLNERITALLRKGSPIPDAVGPSPAHSVDQPIFDEDVLEESVIESLEEINFRRNKMLLRRY